MRFSLIAGLVLRHGERTLELVRQLNDTDYQFEDCLTRRPVIHKRIDILKRIWKKTYEIVVSDTPSRVSTSNSVRDGVRIDLGSLDVKTRKEIERRLTYISALQKAHVTRGQRARVEPIVKKVAGRINDKKPPSASTVMTWTREYQTSQLNPLALMSGNSRRRRHRRTHPLMCELVSRMIQKVYLTSSRNSQRYTLDKIRVEAEKLVKQKQIAVEQSVFSLASLSRRIREVDLFRRIAAREGHARARMVCRTVMDGGGAAYLRSGFRMKQIANSYNVVANGIEQLMTMLILVVGAYTVMNGTEFSIGMLVAFQMFASRVSQPMLRLVGLWQQFQQANLSVQRLGDIMNAPKEPYSILPSRVRDGKGKIEIDDLSFRYAENLPFLYQGFQFRAEPGQVVAIMGPSGSGKSTLAKLLLGFYVPTGGTIKLDGNDIRYLSANELRNTFGVVPQETTLFSGTLYDNLLMANPHASFEQIVHACRMAEIHDTIDQLPQGYQTEIGERGVGLSGGQKQRIAIARALLKQPKILIFDEATSSLDAHTAEHFAATINQLKGKVTMLFITHALPQNLIVDELIRIGVKKSPSSLFNEA